MDVEIIRTHYPVGQGFFSSQQILYGDEKFTCVYDCGSVSENHDYLLNKYMDNLRKTTNTIDLLVLSHFDVDHINGVKNLVKRFNIKKIVIPYLNTFEKLLFLLGKNIPLDSRAMQTDLYFLAYLIDIDNEGSNFLRRIEGADVVSSRDETTPVSISFDRNSTQADEYPSPFWEFSYFSLAPGNAGKVEKDLIKEFKNCLHEKLCQDIEDNISFIFLDRSRIKIIKDLYSAVVDTVSRRYPGKLPGSDPFNFSSVILYSGPTQNAQFNKSFVAKGSFDYYCDDLYSSEIGWLGTGDARLKQKKNVAELDSKIEEWRKKLINTITVPHHGSFYNWSNEFIELFGKDGSELRCVAGADPKCKKYRRSHPHNSVVGSVVCHHSLFYLVSTEPNSFYQEKIKIHLPSYYTPLATFESLFDKDDFYL